MWTGSGSGVNKSGWRKLRLLHEWVGPSAQVQTRHPDLGLAAQADMDRAFGAEKSLGVKYLGHDHFENSLQFKKPRPAILIWRENL